MNTVDEVDLRSTANGELQDAAYGMGFRALVTFDKMMADQTPPQFPVLVFDEVSLSRSENVFGAMVDVLVRREFGEPDYYPVMVAGANPSSHLRELAAGIYGQNPRPGWAGRGYLKAHWDDRDSAPPDSAQLTNKKRQAMIRDSREPTPSRRWRSPA